MESKLEVTIKWENGVGFQVDINDNDGDPVVILEAEENGCIGALWKDYSNAVKKFIEIRLAKIGQEMAQE